MITESGMRPKHIPEPVKDRGMGYSNHPGLGLAYCISALSPGLHCCALYTIYIFHRFSKNPCNLTLTNSIQIQRWQYHLRSLGYYCPARGAFVAAIVVPFACPWTRGGSPHRSWRNVVYHGRSSQPLCSSVVDRYEGKCKAGAGTGAGRGVYPVYNPYPLHF